MASDIKIIWDIDLMEGDFAFADGKGDLLREEGFQTAVLISLFTDRRADDNDILDDDNDKRGWWADEIADIDGDRIGSKLWQLERASTTIENIARCKQIVINALKWMIEDEIAKKIDVNAERQGTVSNEQLAFEVKIYRSDGITTTFKWDDLWAGQYDIENVRT